MRARRALPLCALLVWGCTAWGDGEAPADPRAGAVHELPGAGGAAASEELPPPPPLPTQGPEHERPPPATLSVGERLAAGDLLAITCPGVDALSVERARVRPDGKLFIPFLGRVTAAGLTPEGLAAAIERELTERGYVRSPQVDVEILERKERKIYVLGQIERPGAYDLPFDRNLTLMQVVALAGGFVYGLDRAQQADPSAIQLIRTVEGERRVYEIDLLEAIERRDLARDVVVQSGDLVFVPSQQVLQVFGSVRKPGGYPIASGVRLSADEALGLAGGLSENADSERILLLRRAGGVVESYRLPADPIERTRVQIQAGDTLIVSDRQANTVFVLGSVGNQGGIPLRERDLTVVKVLALAGGLSRIAAANSVRLIRVVNGEKKVYRVPVAEIIESGEVGRDPRVLPGDVIWVPEGIF